MIGVWFGNGNVNGNVNGRWHFVFAFSDAQYYWRNGYRLQIGNMMYDKQDMDMSRRHIETLFHKRIYG